MDRYEEPRLVFEQWAEQNTKLDLSMHFFMEAENTYADPVTFIVYEAWLCVHRELNTLTTKLEAAEAKSQKLLKALSLTRGELYSVKAGLSEPGEIDRILDATSWDGMESENSE